MVGHAEEKMLWCLRGHELKVLVPRWCYWVVLCTLRKWDLRDAYATTCVRALEGDHGT